MFTILTFEAKNAADLALVHAFLDRYSVFKLSPEDRVNREQGPGPFSLRIVAQERLLHEIATIGMGFVSYVRAKWVLVDVYLHYVQPAPYSRRTVLIEPNLALSSILAPGETLGHPLGARLGDLYLLLRVRADKEDSETFFAKKLGLLLLQGLVETVWSAPHLTVLAVKEAFDAVLDAGRSYYRMGLQEAPLVYAVELQTSDNVAHPITSHTTVTSLLNIGLAAGQFYEARELSLSTGTKPTAAKKQSVFPRTWSPAEMKEAAEKEEAMKEPPPPPTDEERAREAVMRKGKGKGKGGLAAGPRPWPEAATERPSRAPPPLPDVPKTPQGVVAHVSKADLAFGETEMRTMHQEALRDMLGWKRWIAADDEPFSGKCQCKTAVGTIVAKPCEHLCLCRPCYRIYADNAILAERCPRCSTRVTEYEELYAPDDFMDFSPALAAPDDDDEDDEDDEAYGDLV